MRPSLSVSEPAGGLFTSQAAGASFIIQDVLEFFQLLANGLVTGSILALAAIGVSLIYSILRLINFAHGDFLTFGAYAAIVVNVAWGGHIILAIALAALATAVMSVGLEFGLWRPMRRRRAGMFHLLITGIGLAFIIRHAIFLGFGAQSRRYDIDHFQVYDLFGVRLSQSQLFSILVAVAAISIVAYVLVRTTLGKSMRALSDNRDLASAVGIDVDRITVYTWIMGGFLAGLAGVLAGLIQASFNPNMGFFLLLPVFAAVILGGIGSAYGALAGGLVLGITMELSTWQMLAGGVDPRYKQMIAFVVLVVVLLVRPQGVLGRARVV